MQPERLGFEVVGPFESPQPGHAYTVWLVAVDNPAACASSPCSPVDILSTPATASQVTFGKAGLAAGPGGIGIFDVRFSAEPLRNGWLEGPGLDNPRGADMHLVMNDHGPVIPSLMPEMIRTYRAGCTDAGLPPIFPPAASARGTPGPNKCRLYQVAVFEV